MSETTHVLELIPDHPDRGVARLPQQFRDPDGSRRLRALVCACLEGIQQMEETIFALLVDRTLDAARGAQLDQWGDLVGEQRGAVANDDRYRQLIRARILANTSRGTTDEIIRIVQLVTEDSEVEESAVYPATFIVYILRDAFVPDVVGRRLQRLIEDAKGAGVAFHLVEAVYGYFGFADDPDALGFGEGLFARDLGSL